MMRINLLEHAEHDTSEPQPAGSASTFQTAVFVGTLLGVALVLGTTYWLLSGWQGRLNQQMAMEKSEAARLARIRQQNLRYEADLQDLNRRIAAVQVLEDNRRGPGEMMTALATAVNRAPGLYLLSVTPKDGRLKLSGAAASVPALASLANALQVSESLHDVQLREYHEDDGAAEAVRFKFSLDCVYRAAAAPSAPVKTAMAAPAVAHPAAANPAVANPAAANPTIAHPAVASPAVANPAVVHPAVAKQSNSENHNG